MKDFWQEIWEYLGTLPVEIASRQITNMWEAKEAISALGKDTAPRACVTYLRVALQIARQGDQAVYEYLCMICRNISDETKMRLPDNLHARMVLGEQNRYVQEYLSHRGV